MKLYLILALFILSTSICFALEPNPQVKALIEKVNIESLLKTVSQLTGEEEVLINDTLQTIKSRRVEIKSGTTYLAEQYLLQRLRAYNYQPQTDTFSYLQYNVDLTQYPTNGNVYSHIYAKKIGKKYPDSTFYICAHFDCAGNNVELNYGADDDASGVAAVLEIAGIFAEVETDYSIVFMFFNAEEILMPDSHIENDSNNQKYIKAAINIDMIAWDGNNDFVGQWFYNEFDYNNKINKLAEDVNIAYQIGLNPYFTNDYAGDDMRFEMLGIPCITFHEDRKDFNKYYHTNNDRMNFFNNQYFLVHTKEILATLAHLSFGIITSYNENENNSKPLLIYPNPASSIISLNIDENVKSVLVYDLFGNLRLSRQSSEYDGNSLNNININELENGCYLLKIQTDSKSYVEKMFVIK